jgi:predicted O-linked N-acetylglucosamine transferase (SPINDLY family)
VSIVGKKDEEVAKLIRRDRIDILVDLAGHTGDNRLFVFAYKPAPVQVSWLGYPNTTGLQAIDYRLTDAVADPAGEADSLHSEKLVRLKNGFLCYRPSPAAPGIAPLPCLEKGHITFGSFNNISKTSPAVVKTWAEIMRLVPNAHLILKCTQFADKGTRDRYTRLFNDEGIAQDRIRLLAKLPKTEDHLDLYGQVDIGLDPFPYNGTTTTCEALWMGVPVVTMLGERHAGRVGASIMHQVGMTELLVAGDVNAYVNKALFLAGDVHRLAELRRNLRSRLANSPLCDARSFAENIENEYRKMWQRWCEMENF